jgi:hypothetical protein
MNKQSKKTNTKELASRKFKLFLRKHLFMVVVGLVLLVGTLAFVLSYGLSAGWDAVAKWFVSKWAILFYISIGLWLGVFAWLIFLDKVRNY